MVISKQSGTHHSTEIIHEWKTMRTAANCPRIGHAIMFTQGQTMQCWQTLWTFRRIKGWNSSWSNWKKDWINIMTCMEKKISYDCKEHSSMICKVVLINHKSSGTIVYISFSGGKWVYGWEMRVQIIKCFKYRCNFLWTNATKSRDVYPQCTVSCLSKP